MTQQLDCFNFGFKTQSMFLSIFLRSGGHHIPMHCFNVILDKRMKKLAYVIFILHLNFNGTIMTTDYLINYKLLTAKRFQASILTKLTCYSKPLLLSYRIGLIL